MNFSTFPDPNKIPTKSTNPTLEFFNPETQSKKTSMGECWILFFEKLELQYRYFYTNSILAFHGSGSKVGNKFQFF